MKIFHNYYIKRIKVSGSNYVTLVIIFHDNVLSVLQLIYWFITQHILLLDYLDVSKCYRDVTQIKSMRG